MSRGPQPNRRVVVRYAQRDAVSRLTELQMIQSNAVLEASKDAHVVTLKSP